MNNQYAIFPLPMNARRVVLQLLFQNKLRESLSIWLHTFSSTLTPSGVTNLVVYVFSLHLSACFISKRGRVLVQASRLTLQSLHVLTRYISRTQLPAHQHHRAHLPMSHFVAQYVRQLNPVFGDTTLHTTCERNIQPSP